jgi:predicted ArsR family transcriptional regulator
MARPLTRRQYDVLTVVQENGPVTVRDVTYHLPITESSARGILSRLEWRGLVDAVYTGTRANGARAYVARRQADGSA